MTKSKREDSLKFKIGKLWSSAQGTTEKFDIGVPVEFREENFEASSNLSAEIMLVKLKNEISALVRNAHIKISTNCEKCLSQYVVEMKIENAEREFLSNKISAKDDPNENFQIDINDMTIDLYEMIRQEIILHFPLISVCSKSCKGLCTVCGKNRNKTVCSCKIEDTDIQKPFKDLKKIIKK
jgi:uncharacterized protein